MTVTGLVRAQYWNLSGPNPTPRTGDTSRAESRTDVEGYLLAADAARNAALHGWGVAAGLEVSAVAGAAGVTVAQGVAFDRDGHVVVLGDGGVAIVDPLVGPTGVQNIPTVPVTATGVVLDTTDLAGDLLLTITWREVEEVTAGLLVLRQAPWLRLVDPTTFVEDGLQLVLAAVTVGAGGGVDALVPGLRRLVGASSGRLELRIPTASAGPVVGHTPAATLAAEPNGDVVVSLLGGPAPVEALRISAGSGDARLSAALHVAGPLSAGAGLSVTGELTVGLGGSPARRVVHVEGTEVHTGGSSGGFSFADRDVASFVQSPDSGQRWVWYSEAGEARLWSGEDLLRVRSPQAVAGSPDGASFDVFRRIRVRSQGIFSAGIWMHQDRDRAFVGMADDTHVGFYGADGAGWGLTMDTASANIGMGIGLTAPEARLHVDGFTAIRAAGRTSKGGFPPFLARGVGVEASGDIGIRSTGRMWAGRFDGDVSISGTLSKGGGGFTIDHPLDPANRYLSHSFVESPEMLNLYAGTVTTDVEGLAWVALPAYFEVLNRDITYQLTAVGRPARLTVAEEVADNRFAIRSEPGEVTVSWLVTGVRQDPWANAHRIVPEAPKPEDGVDLYVHPDLHNVAAERSIFGREIRTADDSTE